MNLLTYTKKLAQQIKFYDIMTKNNFWNPNITNPFRRTFSEPVNVTIVWIDNNDDS